MQVLKYLARYLRDGPISNRRPVKFDDGQVAYRYRDRRDVDEQGRPRWKTGTLATDEFLSLLLTHIPLPGCQTVRRYGLYANTKVEALAQARQALGRPKPPDAESGDLERVHGTILRRASGPLPGVRSSPHSP